MSRHENTSPRPRLLPAFAGPPADDGWLPDDAGFVLLVTGYAYLQEEVERIVAATGGSLRLASDVAAAVPVWDEADLVLLGSDIREVPPRRSAPAALLGVGGEGESLWQLAASLGAERVAILPDAGPWLAEYLSRTGSPERGGQVLGVTGGCGGAGATTAAILLAQAAAGHGIRTLLVDGDPWGGGVELSLAAEDTPGLRWPDFADASGSLDPTQLADSLPVAGGFSFLSWPGSRDRTGRGYAAAAVILEASRRAFELVVVDIGRGRDTIRTFAWDCDKILLVTPAQLRSAVAAAQLVQELPPIDIDLIVRGGAGAALDGQLIADAVGLPLCGMLPEVKSVTSATELGRLLEVGRRRNIRRFADSVLELLGPGRP